MQSKQPSSERQAVAGRSKSSRDLPGWAQVFGSGFTVLTAAVTAVTLGGAAVAVLVALGTAALCVALFTGLNRDPWSRSKKAIVVVASAATAGLAAAATVVAAAGRGDSAANQIPTPGSATNTSITAPGETQQQKTLVAKAGYRLTPSSDPLTNVGDRSTWTPVVPGGAPRVSELVATDVVTWLI